MVSDQAKGTAPSFPPIMQLMWGFMASQALHVGAKLAVFDALRDGPKTAREVARITESNESALRRLLRFLTSVDLLAEDGTGSFSLTGLGATLCSDHPQSARPLAVFYGESFMWGAWGDLYESVKTGKPGFELVHGESFFDFLARRSAEATVFNAAMTSGSALDRPVILNAYDFSGFAKIVDVGGGHGALLQAILEHCPRASGVLCDQPSVLAGADELKRSDVASRCEFVGADMFQTVPEGGDAYILKRVLHDWSDAEAGQILQNCRSAIAPEGKLLVMESVVVASNRPDPAKWMDLNMLVLLTGRERTAEEFADLYTQAGFRLTRVVPAGRLSIIEGAPA